MRGHLQGLLFLNFVTLLWGTTFVVVKDAVDVLHPSAITFARFLVASLFFLPFLKGVSPRLWGVGLEMGFWLWAGYATQAIGLQYTSASRSAFITALNVILVPVFMGLLGRRVNPVVWLSAGMAITGVGLLSNDGAPPNVGDLWTILCALTYAIYILRLEAHAKSFTALPLTAVQVLGVLPFAVLWMLWERPALAPETFPWISIIYLGVITTAATTWLQTLGQGRVTAPEAAIIYSLEPVWASVFAFLWLNERLGSQGLAGAMLAVMATLLAQWRPAIWTQLRGGPKKP